MHRCRWGESHVLRTALAVFVDMTTCARVLARCETSFGGRAVDNGWFFDDWAFEFWQAGCLFLLALRRRLRPGLPVLSVQVTAAGGDGSVNFGSVIGSWGLAIALACVGTTLGTGASSKVTFLLGDATLGSGTPCDGRGF
jgi:hypothetical protein